MEIDEKEARILLELYSAGGAARWGELKKQLVDKELMSETTLYLKLKHLKKEDMGYVQRRLINDELHWELTSKGMYTALKHWAPREIETDELKRELERWREARGFTVKIEELHPEAWWNLVKETIEHLKVKQHLRDLSEEDFMRNMKSYTNQTKRVVAGLWPKMLHDFVLSIGWLVAVVLVYRAFLPSPLRREDAKKLDDLIDSTVEPLSKDWAQMTRDILQSHFQYLEALVVLDKAIEEGKIEPITREMPLEDIIKKLQEHKLLMVEKD